MLHTKDAYSIMIRRYGNPTEVLELPRMLEYGFTGPVVVCPAGLAPFNRRTAVAYLVKCGHTEREALLAWDRMWRSYMFLNIAGKVGSAAKFVNRLPWQLPSAQ